MVVKLLLVCRQAHQQLAKSDRKVVVHYWSRPNWFNVPIGSLNNNFFIFQQLEIRGNSFLEVCYIIHFFTKGNIKVRKFCVSFNISSVALIQEILTSITMVLPRSAFRMAIFLFLDKCFKLLIQTLLSFQTDLIHQKNFHMRTKLCQVIQLSLKTNPHGTNFLVLHLGIVIQKVTTLNIQSTQVLLKN